MPIKEDDLNAMVPVMDERLDKREVLWIVKRHFCDPLSLANMCSRNCQDCKANIVEAFNFRIAARNPAALLTWRMRNEVAKIKDGNQSKLYRPNKNVFGFQAPETNPFMEIRKEIK